MSEEKLIAKENKTRLEEITALQNKMLGLINSLDSRAEKVNILHQVMDNTIAGVEISKIEKAGILAFVSKKRSGE